jgi:PAS domain S-box-containing protein
MNSFKQLLRILFVEDLPTDNELAERQIRQGGIEFTSLRVETRSAFLNALQNFKPDLIISDYAMPEFNGMEALVLAQEYSAFTPLIILTGSMNEDTAVLCMKAGAADYVIKEHMHRLPFAIQEVLEVQKSRDEKAKADTIVRQLSERLQHYVEASPVIMFAFDIVDGNFHAKWVSANIVRGLGYSVEEVLSPGWWRSHVINEEKKLALELDTAWLAQGENALIQEYRFRSKTGEEHWVQEETRVLRTADGKPSEAISAWTDISTRKIAEEQFNLQSEALNAAANAIVITDSNGDITWANPAFMILTGYSAAEVIGKNPRELIKSGKHDRAFYQQMWNTILAGAVWRGEMINRRKDGMLFTEEMTITPICGSNGKIRQFVAIKQDISQRIQAEETLLKSSDELRLAYDSTLQGWSNALELREHETAGHSHRVVAMTLKISQAMGIKQEELVHIERGALLHDIGKMGIPDSILLKPGPLSDMEWSSMRQHPVFAQQLLSKIPYLEPALDIPHYHHEKWDGSGYPLGLKSEAIPLAARIFAIVDVWDALSYDRPYRKAWTKETVLQYLKEQSGIHFDPRVVETFLRLIGKG